MVKTLIIVSLMALLAACARSGADVSTINVSPGEIPPLPVCRDEMRAFIEITKLAKIHGDNVAVFQPAVDAMKDQILDCVDEHYGVRNTL
ncbi:MAG TPA: hypothetical protein VKT70_06750 [Stellaceae bacterium]|nr:hypothetical protein [Stellaceae bacterium]